MRKPATLVVPRSTARPSVGRSAGAKAIASPSRRSMRADQWDARSRPGSCAGGGKVDRGYRHGRGADDAIGVGLRIAQRRRRNRDVKADHHGIERQRLAAWAGVGLRPHDRRERARFDLDGAVGAREDLAGAHPARPAAVLCRARRQRPAVDMLHHALGDPHGAGAARPAPAARPDDAQAAAPRALEDRFPRTGDDQAVELGKAQRMRRRGPCGSGWRAMRHAAPSARLALTRARVRLRAR